MSRLLVSTVMRHTPPSMPSGYFYVVDSESWQVLRRCAMVEPAYKHLDTNPRGGLRGSKGISVRSDQIAISNSMMVFRFSPEWDLLGLITHPACAYIHDITFQGDTLWVTSAYCDLLVQFDLAGNILRSFYLRHPSQALVELNWKPPLLFNERQIQDGQFDFRNPSLYNQIIYDNAHVNSVGFLSDGDILVSMGFIFGQKFAELLHWKVWLIKKGIWPYVRKGNEYFRKMLHFKAKNADDALFVRPAKAKAALVRIMPDGAHRLSLVLPNQDTPAHSIKVLPDDTVIYLNTSESKILRFEPRSREILSSVAVNPGFLRGVGMVAEDQLVIGNKDTLLCYDLNKNSVLSMISITEDPKESVYDVKLLPDHYAMPPASFVELVAKATGCNSSEELIAYGSRRLD